jgi:tetratricopeptide (TPR) repeat protein
MTTSVAVDFDARYQALLDRYEAGEAFDALIPEFLKLRQERPDVRISVALGWLYVLAGQKDRALHFCKEAKGVPQGKYNHALALLAFNEKGVRDKLDEAYRLGGDEGRKDAIENLKDAIKRRGGVFPAAEKMLRWLESGF